MGDQAIVNHVRRRRLAAGLSQLALAERCGVTRQAIHAVETGRYTPNTAVALRLAQALGCSVEALFSLPDAPTSLHAELIGLAGGERDAPRRVQVARVGERLLAMPLRGGASVAMAADGLTAPGAAGTVHMLIEPELAEQAIVVYGCDPALALLGAHLARRHSRLRLIWVATNSLTALRALGREEAHLAGAHLYDRAAKVDNLPAIRRELAGRALVVITLSRWEQGLLIAPGNPKGIHDGRDLIRPDIQIVNREPGAGSRHLLDAWLADAGALADQVRGYARQAHSHLGVAEAVAAGLADAGPGIHAAARALGLDFLPLQEERYDLVVPAAHLGAPPLQALFDTAVSGAFRREMAALGGYDTSVTGTVAAELAA